MIHPKRQILSHNNDLYIIGDEDFDPKKIFENGQTFRWTQKDGAYTFVVNDYITVAKILSEEEIFSLSRNLPDLFPTDTRERIPTQICSPPEDPDKFRSLDPIVQEAAADRCKRIPKSALRKTKVKKLPPVVQLKNAGTMEDYENFWRSFLDMDRDYTKLWRELSGLDPHLKKAVAYGKGLRILKQDLFEMIICFIISSNNNISRIKSITEKLCALAGEPLGTLDGKSYHRFPTAEALAKLDALLIRQETGAGYRADYIVKTSQMIARDAVNLKKLPSLDYEQAHNELCKLHGIGPKVADCILLFGNSMDIAFPVDTWVIKLMKHFYHCEESSAQKIKQRGIELFGDKAGLAQQYLFYYAREHKIGTKEKS